MKLIQKTSTHKIYQRADNRYCVKTLTNKAVNGEEKIAILIELKLIKAVMPKPTEEIATEQSPAEEVTTQEQQQEQPAVEEVIENTPEASPETETSDQEKEEKTKEES